MSFILTLGRDVVSAGSQYLNHPRIKEGIKDSAGFVSLAFGALGAYDLCQILIGRKISTENDDPNSSKWMQMANKAALIAAKFSLVLSAIVSRQGVQITSFLVHTVVTKEQLEGVFGPNTIYAVNPLHPRHIASLVAVGLAIPMVALTLFKGANWVYKKGSGQSDSSDSVQTTTGITDRKVRLMTLFNFITSRPVLHEVNRLARFICSSSLRC